MFRFLGRFFKRTFRTSHEEHPDRGSVGGKTRRKVQVFVNGQVPLSENDLRIMRKKRSFKTKGVEAVFDSSLTESSDIILNIEVPDFVMNDDEDSQSDDGGFCTNPSNPSETSYPGTSATVSPDSLPLFQSLPPPTSHTSSSQPCSPLPTSLGHTAGCDAQTSGPSSHDGDTSPHVSQPEHGGPTTSTDWVCQAGFRTRPFRRSDGPKSVPPGNTRWYYTTGPCRLAAPPERSDLLERGDLFLHEDTRNDQFQAWIWHGAQWTRTEEGVSHPVFGGKRRLWFRFMKEEGRYEPNWIVKSSWNKYKNARRQEIESGTPASPMFKGVNVRVRN